MTTATRETSDTRSGEAAQPILVVLPTLNEVDNIRATLEALIACDQRVEALVVDDASPDGTALVVERVAAEHPGRVHLLRRAGQRGLAGAYQAGFAWGLARGYELIAQMDADGSHPVDRLPAMVAAVERSGVDLVVGSRYVAAGAVRHWPLRRRLLSRLANLYARRVLRVRQHDLTGAYRVWRREALAIASASEPQANGFSFLVEMAATAHRRGLRVVEVPITFQDRRHGSSKMTLAIALEGLGVVWRLRAQRSLPGRRPTPALEVA